MGNTVKSRIRKPVSLKTLSTLTKKFEEVVVENEGIFIISSGFALHDLLEKLSKENSEILIAEHSTSIDYYTTGYIVEYNTGFSKTIETKTNYFVYFNEEYQNFISDLVIYKVNEFLDEYSDFDEIKFTFDLKGCYRYTVNKKGNTAEVVPIKKVPFVIADNLNIDIPVVKRRIIDKTLIPELLGGTVKQNPNPQTNDIKMQKYYNLGFEAFMIASEEIKHTGDKIDIEWCIDFVYEQDNGPYKYY